MGILHKARTAVVDGVDWNDQHDHVPFGVALIRGTTAALTPAAASAAANVELYSTSKTCRQRIDLSTATEARLVAQVIATGNAAGASYKLSFSATQASTWSGADAGPVVVVGSNGGAAGVLHDSGWTALASGAKIDNCYLTVLVGTALSTTAATIGSLTVYFR